MTVNEVFTAGIAEIRFVKEGDMYCFYGVPLPSQKYGCLHPLLKVSFLAKDTGVTGFDFACWFLEAIKEKAAK